MPKAVPKQASLREQEGFLRITATGFRSLREFDLTLTPGVNVLVGPNGSGKTNIVALMEFLSNFISHDLHSAIGRAGGANRVFANEVLSSKSSAALLTIGLEGRLRASIAIFNQDTPPKEETRPIEFKYSLSVVLNKSTFSVSITREELRWKDLSNESEELFVASSQQSECYCLNESQPSDYLEYVFNPEFYKQFRMEHPNRKVPFMRQMFENRREGSSLFGLVGSPSSAASSIRRQISMERSFNISPAKVRDQEDIASSLNIQADGSGVVSTLYRRAPSRRRKRQRTDRQRRRTPYDEILGNFYKVNEALSDFEIHPNLRTGRYECTVVVGRGKNTAKIPFTATSDGTAKWLAILTIVFLNANENYAIEEPENFLHPAVQRLFLEVLRQHADNGERYFIITTHSETIVNATRPKELVICDLEDMGTRARRVPDPERVTEAINETGFGLGFMFANERL